MYGIAIAFVVIWVLSAIGLMLYGFVQMLKPKSRKQRIKELQKKNTSG
jgi:predicted membrane protein